MTSKIDASLRKLSSLSKNLNQVSDELTAQLTSIEDAINALKLGVFAWVVIDEYSYEEAGLKQTVTRKVELGYGKHKGRWALLYDDYLKEMDDSNPGFLREAPRDIRFEAVEKIPELLEKLAEETSKTTDTAIATTSQAKEIADALNKGKAEEEGGTVSE